MIDSLPTAHQTARIKQAIDHLRSESDCVVSSVGEALGDRDGGWRTARTAVVLPGSFNPLHEAHMLLLRSAAGAVPTDGDRTHAVAALSISVHTIDKVTPSGMALEDRAWTMHATLEPYVDLPGRVALIASHGLYLDQATALRSAMPRLDPSGLWFAIGHDKAVQIFDPRYYEDRDSALDALFTLAGLLVAPRSDATSDELLTLVRRPDNKRFADRVRPIALPPQVARLSSTAVRAGLTAGQSLLPSPVAAMIAARQCYA